MASTTYTSGTQPAISDALAELATAARHLLAAVSAKLTFTAAPSQRPSASSAEFTTPKALVKAKSTPNPHPPLISAKRRSVFRRRRQALANRPIWPPAKTNGAPS